MEEKEQNIEINEDTLIVLVFEGLISYVYSDGQDKALFEDILRVKLKTILPQSIETPRDGLKSLYVQNIAGFCKFEDIEIEAYQTLTNRLYGEIPPLKDMSEFMLTEEHLKFLGEFIIIPLLIKMDIDLELEFSELDGLRNDLLLRYGIQTAVGA